MAKVKAPLHSAEARGAISGLVYNTWRGLSTVKVNTSPTGQGTAKRLQAQAVMTNVSKLWRGITQAQRDAWNSYANAHLAPDWTGNNKRITGQNWFMRCNVHLTRMGLATISAAPVVDPPAAPTGLVLASTGGSMTLAFTTPATTDAYLNVELYGPHSPGEIGKVEMASFATVFVSTATSPVTIATGKPAGQYTAFVKVLDTDTGLPSPAASATCLGT